VSLHRELRQKMKKSLYRGSVRKGKSLHRGLRQKRKKEFAQGTATTNENKELAQDGQPTNGNNGKSVESNGSNSPGNLTRFFGVGILSLANSSRICTVFVFGKHN